MIAMVFHAKKAFDRALAGSVGAGPGSVSDSTACFGRAELSVPGTAVGEG